MLFGFKEVIWILFNNCVNEWFDDWCMFLLRKKGVNKGYNVVWVKVNFVWIGCNWKKFLIIIIFSFLNGSLLFLIVCNFKWICFNILELIILILFIIKVLIEVKRFFKDERDVDDNG